MNPSSSLYDFDRDFSYDSSSSNAQNVEFSRNLETLETYLERKDFETIIKDRDLFWLAYCKAFKTAMRISFNERKRKYH